MKFIKGTYAFSEEELNILIEAFKNNEFITIKDKKYIPLHINKKNANIGKEEFENILKTTKVKKVICEKLNTSFYKLTKFIKKTYGTEDIEEISRMCAYNDKN